MNTAPITTTLTDSGVALLPVTIGGVTLPAGSTPKQRLEAHARAGTQSQFHTDSTAARFAQGDGTIAGKAPPPTPQQLERQNAMPPQGTPNANRQAEFDAEMQAKGLQRRPDGSVHADGEVNPELIEKLSASYQHHASNARTEKARDELRASYERDLQRLYNGRPLKELEIGVAAGEVVAQMKGSKEVKARESAPAAPPAKAPGWQNHIEDNEWVLLDKLTTADTSGFTIPRWVDKQRVHVSTFDLLKQAKEAGISQQQVNAVLTQHARRNGWVKS
jgi:hypothetical protein